MRAADIRILKKSTAQVITEICVESIAVDMSDLA